MLRTSNCSGVRVSPYLDRMYLPAQFVTVAEILLHLYFNWNMNEARGHGGRSARSRAMRMPEFDSQACSCKSSIFLAVYIISRALPTLHLLSAALYMD
ncbi:hypothetical protein BGY98DRAFT_1009794, partial [Russula aff. rugulosa BPL654]